MLKISTVVDSIYNRAMLSYKRVKYASYPEICGKLKLQNNGSISIGRDVRFNSSLTSNFVGIYKPCTIAVAGNGNLEIGDHSGFSGVSIYCATTIKIGRYVNCGGNVSIWDTDFHPIQPDERRVNNVEKILSAPIDIGDDVFIGANSIILKGVKIGSRAVIGAGSVVTRQVPADEIWAGNPARFIKKISD